MSSYLVYAFISTLTIASPGPGVMLTITNAIKYGGKAIFGIFGVALGMLVIAIISTSSLGLLVAKSPTLFNLVKIIGGFYLLYLGFKILKSKSKVNVENDQGAEQSAFTLLTEGFLVSISNPKPIIFFIALLPQFINTNSNYYVQATTLSLIFFALAIIVHLIYAFAFIFIKGHFKKVSDISFINKISGFIFIAISIGLIFSSLYGLYPQLA